MECRSLLEKQYHLLIYHSFRHLLFFPYTTYCMDLGSHCTRCVLTTGRTQCLTLDLALYLALQQAVT